MHLSYNRLTKSLILTVLASLAVCVEISGADSTTALSSADFSQILESGEGWQRLTALTDKQALELSRFGGIAISEEFVSRFEEPLSNDTDSQPQISALALDSLRGARAVLPLFSLAQLSVKQAEYLSNFHGHTLLLWGLDSLREPEAKALARFRGDWDYAELDLRGLGTLSPRSAEALAEFRGERLNLDGLRRIDDSVALLFGEFQCQELSLNGLSQLTFNQAQAIGAFSGERLSLDGLRTLTTLQARALASFAGAELSLRVVTITDDAVMFELSSFHGQSLDLSGLCYLSEGQARSLAAYSGAELHLAGLGALSETQALALGAARTQALYLDGLHSLGARQVASLSRFSGKTLSLSSLNQVDISGLRKFSGENLYLTGLTALSQRDVHALLDCRAHMVWLDVSRVVSDRDSAALRQSDSIGLVLSEVESLKQVPLRLLMTWRGGLEFNAVTELDEVFLPALAAWDGSALHLDGVRELQPEQAKALSGFNCAELSVRGLRALTDDDIQDLLQYRGRPFDVKGWSKHTRAAYYQELFERQRGK